MRTLVGYLTASALLVIVGAVVVTGILPAEATGAVWMAAGVAYLVQVVAFVALVAVRHHGVGVLAAWGGGVLLRMAVVLGVALWAAKAAVLPLAPLLLSLAGFLFLLVLLEPVFFRMGMRSS